ncbi:MAG: hypothetical protein D3917_20285 [Candidatus Electrothrix sp. AX5]|nr:hypothetical protein [Candidatus Electrothrix sp. AX5]
MGRREPSAPSDPMAVKFLGASKVGQAIRDRIARLIMVTQTHDPYDADAALMTDIDLSILGTQASCV